MRSFAAVLVIIISSSFSFAQTQEQKDSLVAVLCNALNSSKGLPDSTRMQALFAEHIEIFVSRFPEPEQEEVINTIGIRLSRNCDEFNRIMDRVSPENEYWITVDEKPELKINKKSCRSMITHQRMWYHEGDGSKVYFSVKKGIWLEAFSDGSYSKLRFKWVDTCEFELEFIESDNHSRKNLSKPGDKYRYQIYDQSQDYFRLSSETEGSKLYDLFSIYFK